MNIADKTVLESKTENDGIEISDEQKVSKAQAKDHAALLAGKLAEKMSRRKRRELIFLSY
jgi:hypothetical protein